MSNPYVGEIRIFAGSFAPAGWAFCWGQLLLISEYDTLFALIGTTYGGDGQTTFALPDLRGRVPVHQGQGHTIAQTFGTEAVTLTTAQIPSHNHVPQASAQAGTAADPTGQVWAASTAVRQFAAPGTPAPMAAALGEAGGNQPHDNLPPYLAVNFIISLFGAFPLAT